MFERFLIAILIPALLIVTTPFLNGQGSHNRAAEQSTLEAQVSSLFQAALLGTQTDESDSVLLKQTAPDEVAAGETFTVTEEIHAKVDIDGGAVISSLPQGFQLMSGDLRGFMSKTQTGGVFTNTFTAQAPETLGTFKITATARFKATGKDSQAFMVKDLSINVVKPNQAPVALFVPSPLNAKTLVGDTIIFNATTSFDLDGDVADYQWNLGDGTTLTGATRSIVEHAYAQAGTFTVTLIVVDGQGKASLPKIQEIVVDQPVKPQPTGPDTTTLLIAGGGLVAVIAIAMLLSSGGHSDESSATSSTSTTSTSSSSSGTATSTAPSTQVQTSQAASSAAENKAENFIRTKSDLPLRSVNSVNVMAQVTDANRAQWIQSLQDESVVIQPTVKNDVLILQPYSKLASRQQNLVDGSFSPLGAKSLGELLNNRVAIGDTIVEIRWSQTNGDTFKSLAVVSPSGQVKFDSFITLDP
ncbi:PKD domain-containing protein [Candidatus Acetothermia bacterium]|nr:PKD domain-containing protein [Candidatus Acetothermia bacterium]MBI3643247.1 PKD domain-containing protein [Candidatus Acetothermia bacterium]